jgi:hypothetical protein
MVHFRERLLSRFREKPIVQADVENAAAMCDEILTQLKRLQ